MGKLVVAEWISLDGVVQAPAYPDEDTDGAFAHGGWHTAFMNDEAMDWTRENVTSADAYLLGRRTYEIFAAYWPNAGEEQQVLAEPLNTRPKYVASTTLREPLEWQNSSLLAGDIAEAVSTVKEQQDKLLVLGSTRLVRSLVAHDLVDEVRLMIDPIVLGTGKRIVEEGTKPLQLTLTDSGATSKGALLATYGRTDM
jgi:dihydrofolate reductase